MTYSERNGFGEFWAGNEPVSVLAPVVFKDDFLGYKLNQFVTAEQTGAVWKPNTTAGGAVTMLASATAAHGVASLALTSTNEAQLADIDFGDVRPFVLNEGLCAYFRARLGVLPTGAAIAAIGLQGNHNAAMDTVAESIVFRADGSGAITVETDDTVNETSLVATDVTLVATEWADFFIDCSTPSDVKFYINGTRVAAATTFNMANVQNLTLQPVARISKGVATTVGTLYVDKTMFWSGRASI